MWKRMLIFLEQLRMSGGWANGWSVQLINLGAICTSVLTVYISFLQSGVLSSLPFIAASSCTILGGQLADFLLSRNLLRLINVRKLFSSLGKDRRMGSVNQSLFPRMVWEGSWWRLLIAQGFSFHRYVLWPYPSWPPVISQPWFCSYLFLGPATCVTRGSSSTP